MTHIISAAYSLDKIKIDRDNNKKIRDLHRKLVTLSFTHGNHSVEYQNTLEVIHKLRQTIHN